MRGNAGCGALLLALVISLAAHAGAGEDVRIVSLAPHLTSLAFEAGAAGAVIGTVEWSDHPPAARAVPRIGDAYRVDVERVVAMQPDLVLAWASGTPRRTIEQLERVGLRVVTIATYRLADIAEAIRTIGGLAGTAKIADAAADRFERRVASLADREVPRPLRVFIQVDDQPLYTVNGEHIMSELVTRCGGRNIFADLGQIAPVIGLEAVIAAEPEVIVSTDDTVLDPQAAWAHWSQIPAVDVGAVYRIPADEVAQATTRLLDGLEHVCAVLDDARARHAAT